MGNQKYKYKNRFISIGKSETNFDMIKRIIEMVDTSKEAFLFNKMVYMQRKNSKKKPEEKKQDDENDLAVDTGYGQDAESQFITNAAGVPVVGFYGNYDQPQWDSVHQSKAMDWNSNFHNSVCDPMSVLLVVGLV